VNKDLLSLLIRELNELEEQCALALPVGSKTFEFICRQNQAAVDSSFEPGQTSKALRGCIKTMKQILGKK
jgi:hypothetical protein